jgi:hypothetical protein
VTLNFTVISPVLNDLSNVFTAANRQITDDTNTTWISQPTIIDFLKVIGAKLPTVDTNQITATISSAI